MRFHWLVLLATGALMIFGGVASAADSAFVGRLALAADPQVARDLGLSDEVMGKLAALIDEREREAVDLVAKIRSLPAAERDAKLGPFVAESEKMGLALLTDEQVSRLEKIRIARAGMAGLADAGIAEKLKLTDEQKQEISKQVAEHNKSVGSLNDLQKRAARTLLDKKIAGLLTDEQKAAYTALSGASVGGAGSQAAAVGQAAANSAAAGQAPASGATELTVSPDGKLRFNFRFAPCKDVIDFFARQADLSLVTDDYPPGTINYTDSKSYTVEQGLDVLNSILATKGYQLVRRERMLRLFNVDQGPIPPIFVETIDQADLEKRGRFEFVSVVFQLSRMSPEEAEAEANKLKGPQGSVTVLSKARQIKVSDIGENLRAVKRMIDLVEKPDAPKGDERTVVIRLKNVLPAEFMTMARQLLRIPEGQFSNPDGSLRIAIDDLGSRIIVSGKTAMIEQVQDIVKLVDEETTGAGGATGPIETPQFKVYTVTKADPVLVENVIRTLLAGTPDARASLDTKSGKISVLARPSVHATIRAIANEMELEGVLVEVIKLRKLDPQAAVLAINKLFGEVAVPSSRGQPATPSTSGPRVDADPINMQLMIVGSAAQVEQIKTLLIKMGETGASGGAMAAAARSPYRLLQLGGRGGEAALENALRVWSTMRPNRVNVIPQENLVEPPPIVGQPPQELRPANAPPHATENPGTAPTNRGTAQPPAKAAPAPRAKGGKDEITAIPVPSPRTRLQFVSEPAVPASEAGGALADQPAAPRALGRLAEAAVADTAPEQSQNQAAAAANGGAQPADITIQRTPAGIVVSSSDLDALDEFETLLRSFAPPQGAKEFQIYYLTYAKADVASVLLQEMLSGGASLAGAGGGSLIGDIASNMLGDMGGMASLFFGGGGGGGSTGGSVTTTTGTTVSVTPDPRMNALYVNASYKDHATIQQLLQIIDTATPPEGLQTQSRPKFIPVLNGKAEDMANIIKQVYVGRIVTDSGSRGGGGPSPQEFFLQALAGRGGSSGSSRSGFGSRNQTNRGEEQKMTIGVDVKSNSLIVSAPEYLYNEVKELVNALDIAAVVPNETVKVVSLKRASGDVLARSLTATLGAQATVNRPLATTTGTLRPTTSSMLSPTASSTASSSQQSSQRSSEDAERMRRQMEFFNRIQSQGGFRGGSDSFRGPPSFIGPGGSGFRGPGSIGGFGGGPGGGFSGRGSSSFGSGGSSSSRGSGGGDGRGR
jgi:type II secretory pathway component GspD/PulD (secretin)